MPRMAPDQILRSGVLGIACHDLLSRSKQSQPRQILDVSGQEKRAGVDYQYPKPDVLGAAIELVRDVAAVHPGSDDDDIEGAPAIVVDLGPGAANPAAEHIVGEFGLLNIDLNVWIGVEFG